MCIPGTSATWVPVCVCVYVILVCSTCVKSASFMLATTFQSSKWFSTSPLMGSKCRLLTAIMLYLGEWGTFYNLVVKRTNYALEKYFLPMASSAGPNLGMKSHIFFSLKPRFLLTTSAIIKETTLEDTSVPSLSSLALSYQIFQ